MAGHQKKVRDRGATLIFTDESGFLLLPLVRRTLAPRGRTPVLRHRAGHRQTVSVAAALTRSPGRRHVGLHYQTYPDGYVTAAAYADLLLRRVLRAVTGPAVLIHDRGNTHKGDPNRALAAAFPRLETHWLPPYAPDLNPTEHLWNFEKDKELANFVPHDVRELGAAFRSGFDAVRHGPTPAPQVLRRRPPVVGRTDSIFLTFNSRPACGPRSRRANPPAKRARSFGPRCV